MKAHRPARRLLLAAVVLALALATIPSPVAASPAPPAPGGTWKANCFGQPYAYAQTLDGSGVTVRRFEVRNGDRWAGDVRNHPGDRRQRCEQKQPDVFYPFGTDVWLAFDFRWSGQVPPARNPHSFEIMSQFQQTPEVCDTAGHPPTVSLAYRGGMFSLGSHTTTSVCDTVQPDNVVLWSGPWFPPDTWERIVLRARMGVGGSVSLWLNGALVFDSPPVDLGYPLAGADPRKFPHLSHGIYRNGRPETTVFEFANLQVGAEDLAGRVTDPPPLPGGVCSSGG
jgi:hypothetical protein